MCLPITLASGLKQCQGVAVDGAWVYFADYVGAVVSKVDASGGAPALVAGNQAGAFLIAASSGVVAWGNADSGVVMRLAQGAAPKTIATGQVGPGGVAVDGTRVYWTERADTTGRIRAFDAATGGSPTILADNQGYPALVATGAGYVFWTNFKGNSVMRVAAAGGSPQLVANAASALGVATDGANVYWTEPVAGAGRVMRADLDGANAAPVAEGQAGPHTVVVDPTHVFWTNADAGQVMAASKAGGPPVVLAEGPASTLTQDEQALYWTSAGSEVLKVAKP